MTDVPGSRAEASGPDGRGRQSGGPGASPRRRHRRSRASGRRTVRVLAVAAAGAACLGAGAKAGPAQLLDQYLALTGRFGGLVRDLARWRKA